MKIIRCLLLTMLLWGLGHPVTWAQATIPRVQWGSTISTSVSYTGLGVTAGVSLKRNNLALLIGPRFSLTNSYRFARGPWGGAAALYYYTSFSANRRWQGFANVDYQNSFQKPYCPTGDCSNQRNVTHEISLGYGLDYTLAPRLSVFNAINIGLYRELLANNAGTAKMQVQGLNMLVKLGLIYTFRHES